MKNKKICPKCRGTEFNYIVVIPETTSDTIIAVCRLCGQKIKHYDWYGKSIFDKQDKELFKDKKGKGLKDGK